MVADGWIVEFAIPFRTLRFPRTDEQVWGVNLNHLIRQITLCPVPTVAGVGMSFQEDYRHRMTATSRGASGRRCGGQRRRYQPDGPAYPHLYPHGQVVADADGRNARCLAEIPKEQHNVDALGRGSREERLA